MMQSIVGLLLRQGWKRRRLFFYPLLVLLPLSLAAAWVMPRQYESVALIMLQEGNTFGNVQGGMGAVEMASKVKGLDTLLKSDFVLSALIEPGSAGTTAQNVRMLRDKIKLRQVSDSFVEISMVGGEKVGLSGKLTAVLDRLFEVLLAPSLPTSDGFSFASRKRQAEITTVEKRLKAIEDSTPTLSVAAVEDSLRQASEERAKVADRRAVIDTERADIALELSLLGIGRVQGDLGHVVLLFRGQLNERLKAARSQGQGEAAVLANEAMLARLEAVGARVTSLAARAAALEAAAAQAAATEAAAKGLAERFRLHKELEATAASLKRRDQLEGGKHEAHRANPVSVLRAPGQVQVLDMPQDPDSPLNSRLKLLLIGIAGSFACAFGLAFLVDQLDSTLRSGQQLTALTGLPVLAKFGAWPDDAPRARDSTGGVAVPFPRAGDKRRVGSDAQEVSRYG